MSSNGNRPTRDNGNRGIDPHVRQGLGFLGVVVCLPIGAVLLYLVIQVLGEVAKEMDTGATGQGSMSETVLVFGVLAIVLIVLWRSGRGGGGNSGGDSGFGGFWDLFL